jgi:hypothetical protein
MDSPADESNSLAKGSVVFRQFSSRFIFRSILEYLDNARDTGVHMTCHAYSVRKRERLWKGRI